MGLLYKKTSCMHSASHLDYLDTTGDYPKVKHSYMTLIMQTSMITRFVFHIEHYITCLKIEMLYSHVSISYGLTLNYFLIL